MKKCIVLYSGGLDSRLAIKIMKEQGFVIIPIFFRLPFGCSFNDSSISRLKVFDCTKGKLLKEYLDLLKHPKHGRGSAVNPCIDCKIFIFKKTKEYADKHKIDLIVSGEVLGERPMSQHRQAMNIIERESGLTGRLLRPLSAKFFPLTKAEEKKLVNREELYEIQGRNRKKQLELATKWDIDYPNPSGGCLLCEKTLENRIKKLLPLANSKNLKLIKLGRHFLIDGSWIVLGRDERENDFLEKTSFFKVIPKFNGPTALIIGKRNKQIINKVNSLIKAYSKEGSLKEREHFLKEKL